MAVPDNTRSLTIHNEGPDLSALFKNKYNLQVAKSVITNNQRTCFARSVWEENS